MKGTRVRWVTNWLWRPTRGLSCGAMLLGVCLWLSGAGMTGCAATPSEAGGDYGALYAQGEYEAAYRAALPLARDRDAVARDEAAYVAGRAAVHLGWVREAERYLRQASRSLDDSLRADAMANLGLLQYRLGRYEAAVQELTRAAELLEGEEQAQAYYYAGMAQQRLGRWPQARTTLLLARSTSDSQSLRRQIDETLAVTGYTVQIGAFSETQNARRAAEEVAERAEELRFGRPRLVSAQADGQSLTLVHVGTFSSFQAAHDARARLGANRAIIVPLASR